MNTQSCEKSRSSSMISSQDLPSFLDDVRRHVDDPVDFRPIAVCLLQRLARELEAASDAGVLLKICQTLELVLSKKKSVANLALTPAELASVNGAADFASADPVVYQWLIVTCLTRGAAIEPEFLAVLSDFAMSVVTTVLGVVSYRQQFCDWISGFLASSVAASFAQKTRAPASQLAVSVQLLAIVYDLDIRSQLLLVHYDFDLMLKKLWFCVGQYPVSPYIDRLKSTLLVSQTNNMILDPAASISDLSLLAECIVSCFNDLAASPVLTLVVATCFLRLAKKFYSSDVLPTFVSLLNPDRLLHGSGSVPRVVAECLGILKSPHTLTPASFSNKELNDLLIDLRKTTSWDAVQYIGYRSSSKTNFSPGQYIDQLVRLTHENTFATDEATLYTVISGASNIPCIASKDFDPACTACKVCGPLPLNKNPYSVISFDRPLITDNLVVQTFYKEIIVNFLLNRRASIVNSSPLLTTNLLLALYKLFASFRFHTSLTPSDPVFKFILSNFMTNYNREVRLVASRVFPLFLIAPKDNGLEASFKLIFSSISSVHFHDTVHLAESTIRAYGNLAIICEGEWLCVLFIKLVDLLGESNEHHVNLVYTCLLNIANARSSTPYKMLSPFLPSVSERIIKNSRMFAKLLELLGISRNFFLNRTREYTTPRFLEYYKHDFIQEIADANNSTKSKLILKQLSRIMATYLCKEDTINEKYILSVLGNASPELKGISMIDLISSVGEITWYVLLKIQSNDENDTIANRAKIANVLEYIAKANIKKTSKNIRHFRDYKQDDYIRYLLGEHVLELVQKFSENIYQVSRPFLDKVSSIRAIEFLIRTNIEAASSALGQISTCLQSTIEHPDLEYLGMKCLNVLVQDLNTERLISLFDIVISLIFQRFNALEGRSKLVAVTILKKLLVELRDNWSDHTLYYFSVPFVPRLDEYYQLDPSFINAVKPKSRYEYFPEFTRRLKTRNKYVVKQALDDLKNYTSKYQYVCQSEDFKDPLLENSISELIRTLLDTSYAFKNEDEEVSVSCARVLCIIGALDPNKFSRRTIETKMVIMYDFSNYKENSEFLREFIENQLVTEFWASNDPIKQLYYSYAMQNILEILRLDTSVLSPTSSDISTDIWKKFSDIAKSTLTPFLSSKYFCSLPKYHRTIYPVYQVGFTYETWIITLTSDLLKRPPHSSSKQDSTRSALFHTFATLIRDQDVSICHYILKYAVLSHITDRGSQSKIDIATEFKTILESDSSSLSPESAESLKSCNQIIFEVIDYLYTWVSSAKRSISDSQISESELSRMESNIEQVDEFLGGIQPDLIAIRSAECDSYERTILYLEKCYRDGKVNEENMMGDFNVGQTLQSVYSDINDLDALTGVLRKFADKSLSQKLKSFQYNENWSVAQEAFHVLGESVPGEEGIGFQTKLLKSLNDQALYDEVITNVSSKIDFDKLQNVPFEWAALSLQAAIMSGEAKQLEKWFFVAESIGNPQDVESLISFKTAECLLDLYDDNKTGFNSTLDMLYKIIGNSLLPSSSSSFRNSNLLTQLHVMFDMKLLLSDADIGGDGTVENTVKKRLDNVDESFESQWKILSMHKVASLIRGSSSKTSEVYLVCSEIARKNRRFDVATSNIMKAMVMGDDKANIEYAKLLWDQGKESEAIKSLERIIQLNKTEGRERASQQLLYAEWIDESNHSSSNVIIKEYNKVYELEAKWEKPYYLLGKYYGKLQESSEDSSGFLESQIIRLYLKALSLGPTYIFEALPKLLTIWLDFSQKKSKTKEADRRLHQILSDLDACSKSIPVYVWYTSITQMVSRIAQSHDASVKMLSSIIKTVIEAYPRHSLWFILSHMSSKEEKRKKRVGDILAALQSHSSLNSVIASALELFKNLSKLAAFKVRRGTKRMSLRNDFDLTGLSEKYNCLVIPVRSNLDIKLPTHNHLKKVSQAFPKSSSITFDGADDTVNIFHSLQMPRQITIRGSDGLTYMLMVKKDDTRKDAKVVEFTTMINKLLIGNNEARKRHLTIPNYSVVPLAESLGVIEFVQDVATMKSVIHDEKKRLGQPINDRRLFLKIDEAQKVVKSKSLSNQQEAKGELLKLFDKILKSVPPVLHNWYVNQFPDPASWYLARTVFTRTSAVMSIVGYIIGLGDRHCENILFFKKNGRVLHIDFDCLFEKGSTLPTPEIVPFRLTQNMVDAMGISGVEGTFRITCEVTSALVRENEASLMNILETLLYDPLLDWRNHQNPQEHLKKVGRKIRGLIDEKEGLPMNVHGQVDTLIQQALSNERLSQMYGGWAPYI